MRPGNLLMGAALVALSLSTCLACVWPEGDLDHVQVRARGSWEGSCMRSGSQAGLESWKSCTRARSPAFPHSMVASAPVPTWLLPMPCAAVVQVEGLALKGGDDYTLWPLWMWIFCVFWCAPVLLARAAAAHAGSRAAGMWVLSCGDGTKVAEAHSSR